MDDVSKEESGASYRSPPRTLIPKLVESRDNWKAKASQRQRDLKKAEIRNRDLALSRTLWKQRAEQAERELLAMQQQLQQAQRQLEQTRDEIIHLQQQEEKNFVC